MVSRYSNKPAKPGPAKVHCLVNIYPKQGYDRSLPYMDPEDYDKPGPGAKAADAMLARGEHDNWVEDIVGGFCRPEFVNTFAAFLLHKPGTQETETAYEEPASTVEVAALLLAYIKRSK